MDYEAQLKLQAYLDEELDEPGRRNVAGWLERDQGAVALAAELRNTSQSLAGFEEGVKLPESRDFYWSKLKREIERLETAPAAREPAIPSFARLWRFLAPVAAVAAVAIVCLIAGRQFLPTETHLGGSETALDDSGALTYHDYSAGATLVWLSYPADNEVAESDQAGTME